jgi:hypothetical protein
VAATRRAWSGGAALLLALIASSSTFRADEHNGCAAVNNVSNNRISIFEILGSTGELRLVQEIPTGGVGSDGGYISIPQIAATTPRFGRSCIFASNAQTNSVTGVRLMMAVDHAPVSADHASARATAVAPGPGASPGTAPAPVGNPPDASFGRLGGGLALHPDDTALYTSNPGSHNLTSYRVDSFCGLTLNGPRVPAPPAPADIQVKPDGRCLAIVSPEVDRVALYSVAADRTLVAAGQFAVPGPGHASGVEFSRLLATDTLYVTKAHPEQTVIVRYHVQPDCTLEPAPAVTTVASGRSANVAKLDPENRCLFVPNQASASVTLLAANHPPSTLTTFSVNPITGDLTLEATVEDSAFLPSGLGFATNNAGERSLYYTSFSREVFRRRVVGCQPGPVLESVRTGVRGTGLLRGLTIIQ